MADAPNTFTLPGCRDVWRQMGEPSNIGHMIELLENAIESNPAIAFDTAKSLIESTCRTVFSERAQEYDHTWDLPKLLKETMKFIDLVPETYEGKGEELMKRIAAGLVSTVQTLGELRSVEGMLGHGKAAHAPQLDLIHALFAARAAESVVHFVYTAHRAYPGVVNVPIATPESQPLEDDESFNAYLDELHGDWSVFEVAFKPSDVLRKLEPDSYRLYLTDYRSEQDAEIAEGEGA
jgi:Abortive infection C-terminus